MPTSPVTNPPSVNAGVYKSKPDDDNGFAGSWETMFEFTMDGTKQKLSFLKHEWRKSGLISVTIDFRIVYGDDGPSSHPSDVYLTGSDSESAAATYWHTSNTIGDVLPNESEVPLKVQIMRSSGADLVFSKRIRVAIEPK